MYSLRTRRVGIEVGKIALTPLLRWSRRRLPDRGFSIVLGVPWLLRHLLRVNLRFVARADLTELTAMHVVFDRRWRPEMKRIASTMRHEFPMLPLHFHCYGRLVGEIVESANTANFYNATNCALGLARAKTRYALIHDFDLYPLVPDYFQRTVHQLRARQLRFSGAELTFVDGLTEAHRCIGTWSLGIDLDWLRSHHRPIEIFHRITMVDGVWRHLDPFSALQLRTPERGLVQPQDLRSFCHVRNLPSTHLQLSRGEKPRFVWRAHFLWYLESLAGDSRVLGESLAAMRGSAGPTMSVRGTRLDFSDVDASCANVLADEISRMESFLHGSVRPEILDWLAESRQFLTTHGRHAAATHRT